jgi:murein endopeptidase
MAEPLVKDSRGFFKLPQNPEQGGFGYYTYGTPAHGAGQFAHPKLISLLNLVEFRWQGMDKRKMGVGNISLAGGVRFDPHQGHQSGLDADIRPMRKDGLELPVRWMDEQYDHEATCKLISLFFESAIVSVIYFNDPKAPRVKPRFRHDDHFHVTVLG